MAKDPAFLFYPLHFIKVCISLNNMARKKPLIYYNPDKHIAELKMNFLPVIPSLCGVLFWVING